MRRSARFSLSLVLVTSFAVFACSSDEDDGGDGGGGSSGTTTTGGTSGTGGSATGGSATGGSATGGSATGGSATGGSSGSATGGSATGGSSGSATGGSGGMIVCPEIQPVDEAECDAEMSPGYLDDPCPYGEYDCICGFGEEWDCTTCPPSAPLNGSSCDSAMNRLCQFGLTYCACDPTTDSWECVGP